MFIHISGAHLNPAVTAATIVLGLVKIEMAPVYLIADCLGACLGYKLLTVRSRSFLNNYSIICKE